MENNKSILEELLALKTTKNHESKLIVLAIKTSLTYKGKPLYVFNAQGLNRKISTNPDPTANVDLKTAIEFNSKCRVLEIADNGSAARYILNILNQKKERLASNVKL